MPQAPPPPRTRPYNQSLLGVYGEFGTGANAQIFFLQTTLTPVELNKTTLISDIAGSETWPVRDLFQREVDVRRVTNGLLPYLRDLHKVKFFNPLTLTILPIDPATNEVLTTMPNLDTEQVLEDDRRWNVIESSKFYRFAHIDGAPQYGRLEWNDSNTRLVAIDGQHRLSALKRYLADAKQENRGDFLKWAIPAVVIGFRTVKPASEGKSILEVVRSIFIYINKEAKPPNRARQILLTDESVNAVCAQELLQLSHTNDVKPASDRDAERLPLLFFDWRGEEEEGKRALAPAAVVTIEEVEDWLAAYVLGEDFDDAQQIALGIQPVDPLKQAFLGKRLRPSESELLRTRWRTTLLPALAHLLEHFTPYRCYADQVAQIEAEFLAKSDVARHAFYQLRFGASPAPDNIQKAVRSLYDELVGKIQAVKDGCLKYPMDHDIGMRGVLSAFGTVRDWHRMAGSPMTWTEYAKWFVTVANELYAEGWLSGKNKRQRDLLLHIIRDQGDNVVNYRLEAANDAFGAYLAILIGSRQPQKTARLEILDQKLEDTYERLFVTLIRGYKKEWRPRLKDDFPQGGRALTEAVRKKAEQSAEEHQRRLQRVVEEMKVQR